MYLVVHEMLSVLYFLLLVTEIIAFLQNWTCKQEVGHCDLSLQQFFFDFDNSHKQSPIYASYKISAKYTMPFCEI